MKMEESYRSWKEFEEIERRRVTTVQLSIDDLARDLYVDPRSLEDEDEVEELNFDL